MWELGGLRGSVRKISQFRLEPMKPQKSQNLSAESKKIP